MIRVTKTSKLSKRKNPHLEDIEEFIESNSSDFRYLNKGIEGKTFYFKLNKKLVLNTEILKSGEYVLKIFFKHMTYSIDQIKKLKILSKYGLIPKIFVVTNKYIIMKYIKGNTFYALYNSNLLDNNDLEYIEDRKSRLIAIWAKLGFEDILDIEHNDENILVSEDLNHVYVIDPFLRDSKYCW